MNVKLTRYTISAEEAPAEAAAICTNAKDPQKALFHALKSGHESVMEHSCFTFLVEGVSRVTLAQATRHRLASFSVQSQRYCGADMDMVIPKSMERDDLIADIVGLRKACAELYKKAVGLGVPAEDARYFTLQGGKTRFMMTMNARELRHFFSLRMCNRAQWEIRQMADAMWKEVMKIAPSLFENAGPGCVRGGCPESRPCGKPRKNDIQALLE